MKKEGVPIGDNFLSLFTKLTSLAWALLQGLRGPFGALELEDLPYASAIEGSILLKTVRKL